ncbi:MAG: hypothetical protein M3461_04355 [Pseudomonadota bacterium]|nr:hypothetical protein [Pseudomonadota bacterium]
MDLGWRAAGADLSIDVLSFPDPVPLGQTLSYLLTVRNIGAQVASNVTLTDTLPAGVELVSTTPSQGACSVEASTVTCSLGDVGRDGSATVQIDVRSTAEGVLSNNAVVTATADANPANNTVLEVSRVNTLPPGLTCKGRPLTQIGSEGADLITGTPGPDVIAALGGNDVIDGLAGDDVICADAGHDTVRGGPGQDTLFGEAGNDTLLGGPGRDRLSGGGGVDRCLGEGGRDRATGCGGKEWRSLRVPLDSVTKASPPARWARFRHASGRPSRP